MKNSFIATLALLLTAGGSYAGVLSTISGNVRTSNYTGAVIEADNFTGHVPNRSTISGEWSMDFNWDGIDNVGVTVESTMWFEDDSGTKVSIVPNGGGPAVTTIVEEYQTSLNAMATMDAHTFAITFKPQSKLSPQKRYTMKAKWRAKRAGEPYGAISIVVPVHGSSLSTQQYYHFTNTVSGDAGVNVQSFVSLNSWSRQWMIAGSATQGTLRFLADVITVRFDDFNTAPVNQAVITELTVSLKKVSTGEIVWTAPGHDISLSVPSHAGGTGATAETSIVFGQTFVSLNVPPGVLEASQQYVPIISVGHSGEVGGFADDGARTFDAVRLLRFSGNVFFGSLLTTVDQVSNDPVSDLYPNALPYPTTTLGVPAGHGTLPNAPGASFGNVSLAVQILPNGDVEYGDGTQIYLEGLSEITANGVTTTLGTPYINTSGAHAEVTVHFPDGFSIANSSTATSWESEYHFGTTSLPSDLSLPTLSIPGSVFCYCDQAPLLMETSSLSFDGSQGRFTIASGTWRDPLKVDKDGLGATLAGGSLANPGSAYRPSNMHHFIQADGDAFSNVIVSADAAGRARFGQARIDFAGGGLFFPHFPIVFGTAASPFGPPISGGTLQFNDGAVTTNSHLDVGALTLFYNRNAATGPCATTTGLGSVLLTPTASLQFTPDGGLTGNGTIDDGQPIKWGPLPGGGAFAHQLPMFANGSFHMPGYRLAGDAAWTIDRDQRPVALLYTGAGKPTDSTYLERPDDQSYASSGTANYAGVTVRSTQGLGTAFSYIAGVAASYDLTSNARYYLRANGVTGITDSTGGFTVSPIWGGMGLTLNHYRLAFIDNLNTNSLTDGSLSVGSSNVNASPVDLHFQFAKLFFGPEGQPTTSELSDTELVTTHTLRYWHTDFVPKGLTFRQPVPADGSCPGPDTGFLALAVDATLPLLPSDKVRGVLGFKGNGDLLGKGDPLTEGTGIDSRFQLPSNVKVAGGGGSGTYTLQPVVRAYLNRWEPTAPIQRPANGFLSVAGRLDVPFFEAMKLHLHADTAGHVYFMGGWEVSDVGGSGLGWAAGVDTFFNKPDFDALNIGFPGNNVDDYRNDTTAQYNPRVFKNWYKMVNFDYSLKRSPTGGFFQSTTPVQTDLLLFKLSNQVTRLTPSGAEINFDGSLAPNLPAVPNLSVGSLIAATGLTDGIAQKFASALGLNLSDITSMSGAFDGINGLVQDSLSKALGPYVEAGMEPVVDALYSQLQSKYSAVGGDTGTALVTALQAPAVVNNITSSATSAVSGLVSSGTNGLTKEAADRVGALKTQAHMLASAVQGISTSVSTLSNAVGSISGNSAAVDPSITGTLNTAAATLNSVADELADAENDLRGASGALFSELGSVASAQAAGVTDIATKSLQDVASMVLVLNAEPNKLFDEYPEAEMKKRIRNIVRDRFFGSSIASEYQRIFKSYLNPLREGVQKETDQIMAEIEGAARAQLDVPIAAASPVSGSSLGSALGGVGLHGFARINGNSLETLRLDGDFSLNILSSSDEVDSTSGMKMKAWLEVQSIQSNSAGNACSPLGGASGLTVELGAKDIPIGWGTASGNAYASVKFGFDTDAHPVSFDGSVGMNGSFTTGGFKFSEPKIVVGAGPNSLYAGFALRAAFNGKEVAARCVLGEICGLDPLKIIDPKAGTVLEGVAAMGQPTLLSNPLLGGSLYAEAWFPLNELIGIPTTCLLNLRAGAGAGFMFWKPIGAPGIIVGTQQFMGLSGEVLCAIGVEGSLSMVGVGVIGTGGDNVIGMTGTGEVSAEIGVCPFCVDFSKTISSTATFNLSTGKITSTGFDF